MSSDRYDALSLRIDNMADWKACSLCVVSSSKVAPVVARVGLPSTWRIVEMCMEYAWSTLRKSISNEEEGRELAAALESTPEWECEDNSFLPFAVTEALDFVKLAVLAAATSSCAKDNAKGALDALVGIASSYDFSAEQFLAHEPGRAVDFTLQAREEESQERLVTMLERAATPEEAIASLRQEAQNIATLFRLILPMVCYVHVSD